MQSALFVLEGGWLVQADARWFASEEITMAVLDGVLGGYLPIGE